VSLISLAALQSCFCTVQVPDGVAHFKEMYKQHLPTPPSATPYFLENDNPHKKFIAGYNGHVPNLLFVHSYSYTPGTNRALKLFTTRYNWRKSNARLPITNTVHSEPKSVSQKLPYESGIIKNYQGHIPGYKFNTGQTFSEGSKNTRTVLRGQHL